MKWDLYVDESGSFEENKRCLVGGFIVPEGKVNREQVHKWKEQIQAIPEIHEKILELRWKYDHCMRNTYTTKRKNLLRGELQYLVVNEYKKRITNIGGKIIIFDNAKGIFNTDNTTNFLTVLAKGLMMLYYDWPEKDPEIRLHFASRKNMTFAYEPDTLPVSPTRVMEPDEKDHITILPSQYIAQIRNLAFLQAGQELLDNETFSTMLDTIDIIQDDLEKDENGNTVILPNGKESRLPNPLTVPCDYICNTLIKADEYDEAYQKKIKKQYDQPNVLIYHTDRPLTHALQQLRGWEIDRSYGKALLELISENFLEPTTSRFMQFFNNAPQDEQKAAIDYIIRPIRKHVESQENMLEFAERLGKAIDLAGQMENEQIRFEYIANLLIFQESLYTHLGNQKTVSQLREQFIQIIGKIEDDTVKDELLDIEDNRKLVSLTDNFDYDAATELFESIEQYWNQTIQARQRRHPAGESPKYPSYGRTIGSYLQTLRHEIHAAEAEDKELYYSEAKDRFNKAHDNLIQPIDKSRFHQTACDIEAEIGLYQEAYKHLYLAALTANEQSDEINEEIAFTKETAKTILEVSGYQGEKYPFLLQHYVRLLSMMFMSDPESTEAEILLQPLIDSISDKFGDLIGNPHPRTQIQWKTASMLAFRKASTAKQRLIAANLFTAATNRLKEEKQAVFWAIAAGIYAEEAWHIEMKHIAGDSKAIIEQMKQVYQWYLPALPKDKKNPFDQAFMRLSTEEILNNPDMLLQMSYKIGY